MKMIAPMEIGICCKNLDKMRKFYEDILGLCFVGDLQVEATNAKRLGLSNDCYKVVRLQTSYGERIKLLSPLKPPMLENDWEYILDKQNTKYLTFIIEDLNEIKNKLQDFGVKFLTDSEKLEVRPGLYAIFFYDPEGNVLELVEVEDIRSYRPDL